MSDVLKQVLLIFVLLGVPGIIAAWIAFTKGRNILGWFLLCFFFPPTMTMLIHKGPLREVNGQYRQCPSCKEFQKWRNTVCKYCGTAMATSEENQ
jgi:hypothetical protein